MAKDYARCTQHRSSGATASQCLGSSRLESTPRSDRRHLDRQYCTDRCTSSRQALNSSSLCRIRWWVRDMLDCARPRDRTRHRRGRMVPHAGAGGEPCTRQTSSDARRPCCSRQCHLSGSTCLSSSKVTSGRRADAQTTALSSRCLAQPLRRRGHWLAHAQRQTVRSAGP